MRFKLLFVFSVFAGLCNDLLRKKYLSQLDIFSYLFVLNLASFILLACMFCFIGRHKIVSYYRKRSYLFIFKKLIRLLVYNIFVCIVDCNALGVSLVPLLVLVNLVFVFFHILLLLFRSQIITFNYTTVIRSIISTGGLFLTLNEFDDSNMTQITSGYYSISIADFLYTSSRVSVPSIWMALGALMGLILSKDILVKYLGFMRYEIFSFNVLTLFIIAICMLMVYIYRKLSLLKAVILLVVSCLLMLLNGNMSLEFTLNVNLLLYMLSITLILWFLYKKSNKVDLINYIIIGFNIFVLIIYKTKIMAIIGSVFFSIADIIIRNYAKDTKSELMIYSLTLMGVSLPILFIGNNYNILQMFMINTSHFPVAGVNWIAVWMTALTGLIIQFAIVVCFSKHSLNTYLPFRYIDLVATCIIERRYDLAMIPSILSLLFGYFL